MSPPRVAIRIERLVVHDGPLDRARLAGAVARELETALARAGDGRVGADTIAEAAEAAATAITRWLAEHGGG